MAGCKGHVPAIIPHQLQQRFDYTGIHTRAEEMADFCKAIALENNKRMIRLPLCHTLFSEAYGAQVKLGDWVDGPRVMAPALEADDFIGNPEALKIKSWIRVESVLDAMKVLIDEGYEAVLLLDGPITLLSNVLGFDKMLRLHRKSPDSLQMMLTIVSETLISFSSRAMDLGVRKIDFGDPLSAVSILGPVVRRSLADEVLDVLLGRLSKMVSEEGGILRVCPLTSNGYFEGTIDMRSVCISEL